MDIDDKPPPDELTNLTANNEELSPNQVVDKDEPSMSFKPDNAQKKDEIANIDKGKASLEPTASNDVLISNDALAASDVHIEKEIPEVNDSLDETSTTALKTDASLSTVASAPTAVPKTAEDLTDEYHYVKSGQYTSEMFKVVVQNIPGKVTYGV